MTLLATTELEGYATFSPDGKWLAYCSDEPVKAMTSFVDGGASPHWSADGSAVFYGAPDGDIVRVPLSFTGDTARPGTPQRVVRAPSFFLHGGFVLDRATSRLLTWPPVRRR